MQYLILFARDAQKTDPIPEALRELEFHAIRRLYAEGVVRQIWLRSDVPGACALVEADSLDKAAASVERLPLVDAGFLQRPVIVPLKPYAGFTVP
jgi:uncharacterized protein YciI